MRALGAQGRALGLGLALVLLWGASFSIQKTAYLAMTPSGFLFARYVILSVFAAALLWWRRGSLWPQLTRAQWRVFLRATFIGQIVHILLITYGIHHSTAFSSSLIFACGPVFTLLLVRWIGKGRLQPAQIFGVAMACAGVLLFMAEKLHGADRLASGGDAMMLAGVMMFSLYTVISTPLVERFGGVEVMCYTTPMSSPLVLAITAWAAWSAPWSRIPAAGWGAFFWTVLISAFGGWIMWARVNAVRGVARSAPLLYLVPLVAGVVAWWAQGEAFGPQKLAGAALALTGAAIAQWKSLSSAPRDPNTLT